MRVCIFTGSRSEYGLLKKLILTIQKNRLFKSNLIVTGSHLSKRYGFSLTEIKNDKVKITKKIYINLNDDSSWGIGSAFSELMKKLNTFFKTNKYDLIILLGDRYEALSAGITSYINRIPILHIHGGEKTLNSLDENYRHCISKLANIHCVSHLKYKKRLIQLGEKEKNIFHVGGLGAEIIKNFSFIRKKELEKNLNVKFKDKIIIINYYPEILNLKKSFNNLKIILNSLKYFLNDCSIIFTLPSHDISNDKFSSEIKIFCKKFNNAFVFKSLGQKKYYSLLNISNLMIGNSSSGVLEMPSFKKFSINLGSRQAGRIFSKSVINLPFNIDILKKNIKICLNKKDNSIKNVYHKNNTTKNILNVIKKIKNNQLNIKKKFIDII